METADNDSKNIRIEIGGKLRELRENAGLTQRELAERAGMVQSMITRFETGEREILIGHAKKFASVFGIAPIELLPPGLDVPARQVTARAADRSAGTASD